MAESSAQEQLILELINRARLDPVAEAKRLGIKLNSGLKGSPLDGTAKQPLAANDLLNDSAAGHSLWMLANDVFSHTGSGGSDPGDRMAAAGYTFTGSWTWGENIAWSGTTGVLNVNATAAKLHDNLFKSPEHRLNILNGTFREIGVGLETGTFKSGGTNYEAGMVTENFAKSGSSFFVTGVAIADADHDLFYDIGEGRSGIAVTLTQGLATVGSDTTGTAGGYAAAYVGGDVQVVFSGGDLAAGVTVILSAVSGNSKVDLIGSDTVLTSASATLGSGAVDLVLLGIGSIDGTGNADDNHLTGGRGVNILSGGDGMDTLTGGAGRDFLSGGAAADTFDFNVRSDSGRKSNTADHIQDFVQSEDLIDLSDLDANSKMSGLQDFIWRGTSGFSGKAGQLRYVKIDEAGAANDRTLVMADTNGDKKVDFTIYIEGLYDLGTGDFIL